MTIEIIAQAKTRYPCSLSHMREVGIRRAGMVAKNVTNMMMALTMAAARFICELQSTNVGTEGLTNRSGDIVPARGSQQLFPVLAHDSCGLSLSWGRR
jgi:DNA repair ATPase RecN